MNWGTLQDVIEFSYQRSLVSPVIAVCLMLVYLFQIFVKERSKPEEPEKASTYNSLQICNDYASQYSITCYLLFSMMFDMSRSVVVVLESEAQLLLLCALGVSLLTYLLVDVRAYFQYVHACLDSDYVEASKEDVHTAILIDRAKNQEHHCDVTRT